ncbi:MAG TPA: winged helix-turn-helix domain-containing protein [Dokdonella sp.]|nr:winged helix-turn-helix domain-containing protein [Dokdonella sp.]
MQTPVRDRLRLLRRPDNHPDGDFFFSSLQLSGNMSNHWLQGLWSRQTEMRFRFAGFILDATERRLLDPSGNQVSCAPKTLDALRLLAEKGGQLVSRDDFHEQLWPRSVVADETLAKLIWQVRKALEPVGEELIETVPRHGYRLRAEVAAEAIGSIGLPASAELPPSVSSTAEVAAATPAALARHRAKSQLLVPIGAALVVLVVLAALGARAAPRFAASAGGAGRQGSGHRDRRSGHCRLFARSRAVGRGNTGRSAGSGARARSGPGAGSTDRPA